MATNPMQRKARNSFLLGMLLMLVIAAIIVAFLILQIKNYRDKEAQELAASVNIAVLNQDVKSGQIITSDMLTQHTVNRNLIPSNAIGDVATLENYNLQDREGNTVSTKYDEENDTSTMYLTRDGRDYVLSQEEETGNYYITVNNQREYVELNSIPVVAKVAMNRNSVLTRELVTSADNTTTNDVRQEEFNMIVLPTQITTGDYVDIRLTLPSGQSYIVVSKKEVTIPEIDGVPSVDTIWMNLSEAEILMINNAIVEAYYIDGAKLYANIYTEIKSDFENYIYQSGLDESVLENIITVEEVTQDTNQIIANIYNGDNKQIDVTALKERLNNNIKESLSGQRINSSTQKAIDEFVNKIADQYIETMSHTNFEKTIHDIYTKVKEYVELGKKVIIVAIGIIIIAILAIQYKKIFRNFALIGISFTGSGLFYIFVDMFINAKIKIENIIILNDAISITLRNVLTNILNTINQYGWVFFGIGIALIVIGNILNNRKAKNKENF